MPAKIMKCIIHNIILLSICFCFGCISNQTEELIANEYLRLNKDSELIVTVNDIELIEIKKVNFIELANIEISRIDSINKLNTKIVVNLSKLDSLLSAKILNNECFYPNANSEFQQKFKTEIKADSAEMKSIAINRLKTQIETLENENKIYEILSLLNVDSIQMTENLWIKHRVNLTINNKSVKDTFVYVSFNNGNYGYLNVNPLIGL